jgi:hypothetical protein
MRIDRTAQEPTPLTQPPSWDNSTLRNRLEARPAPGAELEALHALARERHQTTASPVRKHRRRR